MNPIRQRLHLKSTVQVVDLSVSSPTSTLKGALSTKGSAIGRGLRRHLVDLGSESPLVRSRAAYAIRLFAQRTKTSASNSTYDALMKRLLRALQTVGETSDVFRRLGYVAAVDELVGRVSYKNEMVIGFANQLSKLINSAGDAPDTPTRDERALLRAAAKAFGHLARVAPPTLMNVFIERMLTDACRRLTSDSPCAASAAAAVVAELATDAPAVFYTRLNDVLGSLDDDENIPLWTTLCHAEQSVREASAVALRRVLALLSSRRQRKLEKHYRRLYAIAMRHLTPHATEQCAHASLLTLHELCDRTTLGDFMEPYFEEVYDSVFEIDDAPALRCAELSLLPRLAHFAPVDRMTGVATAAVGLVEAAVNEARELDAQAKSLFKSVASKRSRKGGASRARSEALRWHAFRALSALCVVPRLGDAFISPYVQRMMRVVSGEFLVGTALDAPSDARRLSEEALDALTMIASTQGLGREHRAEMAALVPTLFTGGLTSSLLEALTTISKTAPFHAPAIQTRLLDEIIAVLGGGRGLFAAPKSGVFFAAGDVAAESGGMLPNSPSSVRDSRRGANRRSSWVSSIGGSSKSVSSPTSLVAVSTKNEIAFYDAEGHSIIATDCGLAPVRFSPISNKFVLASDFALATTSLADSSHRMVATASFDVDVARQKLALRALGAFDFDVEIPLLNVSMWAVLQYFDSADVGVRLEAAVTCCRLLSRARTNNRSRTAYDPAVGRYVVERLVVLASSDDNPEIRRRVVYELDARFVDVVAETPENLESLFVLANDADVSVRGAAVVAVGRASSRRPDLALPSLRVLVLRLVKELQLGGGSGEASHRQEIAATIAGLLVRSLSPGIGRPFCDTLLEVVLPKIDAKSSKMAAPLLATLGEIAVVSPELLSRHVVRILDVVVAALLQKSTNSPNIRGDPTDVQLLKQASLMTFTSVVRSSIVSVWPYFHYRKLLDLLLSTMSDKHNPWSLRRQALVTLGTLGALDPWLHKINRSYLAAGDVGLHALSDSMQGDTVWWEELNLINAFAFELSSRRTYARREEQDDSNKGDSPHDLDEVRRCIPQRPPEQCVTRGATTTANSTPARSGSAVLLEGVRRGRRQSVMELVADLKDFDDAASVRSVLDFGDDSLLLESEEGKRKRLKMLRSTKEKEESAHSRAETLRRLRERFGEVRASTKSNLYAPPPASEALRRRGRRR